MSTSNNLYQDFRYYKNIAKIKFESRIIYVNTVIIVTMSVDKTASKNGKIDSYGKIKSPRNNYGSQQTVVERDT
jgi:hypothetical protein